MFVSTDWKFSGIPFFLHLHQSCWMKILHDNMYYCRKIFQIIFWYKCQQKDLSENQWPLMQNFTQSYNLNLYCSQESSLGNFTMTHKDPVMFPICSSNRPNLLDFWMIFLRTNNIEAAGKEQKETSAKEDIFAG